MILISFCATIGCCEQQNSARSPIRSKPPPHPPTKEVAGTRLSSFAVGRTKAILLSVRLPYKNRERWEAKAAKDCVCSKIAHFGAILCQNSVDCQKNLCKKRAFTRRGLLLVFPPEAKRGNKSKRGNVRVLWVAIGEWYFMLERRKLIGD